MANVRFPDLRSPTMFFVGVSTGRSFIRKLFPVGAGIVECLQVAVAEDHDRLMDRLPDESVVVIVYVPPHWKHRSVNVGRVKMISLFAYPADAGHEYGEIERKGMRKIVVEVGHKPELRDNPAYGGQ